jgi:hypothetical protein
MAAKAARGNGGPGASCAENPRALLKQLDLPLEVVSLGRRPVQVGEKLLSLGVTELRHEVLAAVQDGSIVVLLVEATFTRRTPSRISLISASFSAGVSW